MPVIAVDKPLNLTSHDVVARARKACQTKRVGHTGTLDPLATGVLVLCVESSTKLVQFMEADSKDYLAWIALGAGTPTLDAEGPIEETTEVSLSSFLSLPNQQSLEKTLAQFVGPQKQIPPQYSAIQVGGQRAYAVARAGGQIDLPARDIVIHSLDLLEVGMLSEVARRFNIQTWEPVRSQEESSHQEATFTLPEPLGDFPTLLVKASVGSGTYLRSLARDVGAALGVPAHLAGLVRTRVGRYSFADAVSLENVAEAKGLPDAQALNFPIIEASEQMAKELRQGKRPKHAAKGRHTVLWDGELVAVADGNGSFLKVVRVWA